MSVIQLRPPTKRQPGPYEDKRLPLHARDGAVRAWVIVDDDDFSHLGQWRWSLDHQGYACRKKGGRKGSVVRMHRELLGLSTLDRVEVDHVNRIKLDNRRHNLRVVPVGSQPQNTSGLEDASSRFRGVTRKGRYWLAQVGMTNAAGVTENHYLGVYQREQDAAAVAAQWRHAHFPLANEDPVLLAREVTRRPHARRLNAFDRYTLLMLAFSTTLSRREMHEQTGIGLATIKRVIGPGIERSRLRPNFHHEACL